MSEGNYVYVMCFAERDHKIGFSNDPMLRRKAFRGVRCLVRTWHRPNGDAQAVEAMAHRLLADWRAPLPGERERFEVNEAAACHAVECAIALVADRVVAPIASPGVDTSRAADPPVPPSVTDREAEEWARRNPGRVARAIIRWNRR